MKAALNKKIRAIVENGNYKAREFATKLVISNDDYHYYTSSMDNVFHFQHKGGVISLPLKGLDWRIFWDKLGNIPIDEDGDIEEDFEHFCIGTDLEEIWHWIEWFFDISIGEEYFK